MRAFEVLTEQGAQGTLIAATLTPVSLHKIAAWIDQNKINNVHPLEKMHVTIMVSKSSKIPWKPKQYSPPIKLNPNTYKFQLFGKDHNILVLCFDSDKLQQIHKNTREKYQLPWDFPTYQPHLTISYSAENNDINDIKLPDFPIYLDKEYVDVFNQFVDENMGAGIITPQSTTIDVKPGEIQRQAKKFGWKVDKNGIPPVIKEK